MTKPQEVKPCQFCGPMNGHYGFTISSRFGTRLTCFCCDSHGPRAATKGEAIAAWNNRTPDPAVQAPHMTKPRVKPLVWSYNPDRPVPHYISDRYVVQVFFGSDQHYFETWEFSVGKKLYDGDDLPAAKAAAQADYEAHILSALDLTPDPAVQALVEALRWQAEQPEAHPFMANRARSALAAFDKTSPETKGE